MLLKNGEEVDHKTNTENTPLTLAASKGFFDVVTALIIYGANVNHETCVKHTSLTLASEKGYVDIVNLLIWKGANVNHRTCKGAGNSALTLAALEGHLEVVKLLILNGANIDHKTDQNDTALNNATNRGHPEIVKCLLSVGADKSIKNIQGHSPEYAAHIAHNEELKVILNDYNNTKKESRELLFKAVFEENFDSVKLLLARGADVNNKDNEENTILHIAAAKANKNIVKLLLSLEADRSAKNQDGKTPHDLVKNTSIAAVFERYDNNIEGDKEERLLKRALGAVRVGKNEIANILIVRALSSSVESRTQNGQKILHQAAAKNNSDIVKILLWGNISLDAKDEDENTALHIAAKYQNDNILEILLSVGANYLLKNRKGQKPIDFADDEMKCLFQYYDKLKDDKIELFKKAVSKGDSDIVNIFLHNYSVNVDQVDDDNRTALHLATESENDDILKLIIDRTKDIELANKDGNTALHIATGKGNPGIVKILVKKINDIDIKNKKGNTVLHMAIMCQKEEIVKIFIANEASFFIKNNKGETPLDLAIELQNEIIVKLLLVQIISLSLNDDSTFENEDLQNFLGESSDCFFLRTHSSISLLQFIINKGTAMLKEREELLTLMVKIDRHRYPNDLKNSEFRVRELLKVGLPPSKGLEECIESLSTRYPWGKDQMWFVRLLSVFKNIIIGWGVYFLDVGTDLNFSMDMFENSKRNFTEELESCLPLLSILMGKADNICKDSVSAPNCSSALKHVEQQRKICFETGKRFDDSYEWKLAGIVSVIHCVVPFLFSFLVFLIFCISHKKMKDSNKNYKYRCYNIFTKMPLPFISKFFKTVIEWKLYSLNTNQDKTEEKEKKKQTLLEELEMQEEITVLSMVIESSLEACFQFWFQTVYLLPSLILVFMDINDGNMEVTDLINFKILSIVLSFLTFTWASFTIRYSNEIQVILYF